MAPLTGIRVADFSRVLAGPHCAQNLLDLGAEVIKIEPPSGDMARRAYPRCGEISGYYAQQNAGKRNISIDLNVEGAREIALRLCDEADIVVENFRPGTLAAFGLGYDDVAARNPRVVYASISGYGQHGSWRSRAAYAPTVQAETGVTEMSNVHWGTPQDGLRSDSLSHADVYSGLHAAIAILAALNERSITGRGQYIDVAMAAVMLAINERVHVDLSNVELGDEPPILGATDCAFFIGPDGKRFISPVSLVSSLSFPFYLAAMRRPDLAADPRFATPTDRRRNLEALHEIVQSWIWTFTDMASLEAQLDEAKIPTGSLRDIAEFATTEWAAQWGATRTVPDGAGARITVPGQPWHFTNSAKPNDSTDATETTDTGAEPDRQPARQGEHNEEVLHELGYSDDEISDFTNRAVLVHARDTH
jgi:crotonobetainyl-CoA:carnitine CoA-transferase CaiB-like acyl-CoA transferase